MNNYEIHTARQHGLIVSKLSFGAMTFGSDPSITSIYKVNQDDAQKMVNASLEAGINFIK